MGADDEGEIGEEEAGYVGDAEDDSGLEGGEFFRLFVGVGVWGVSCGV